RQNLIGTLSRRSYGGHLCRGRFGDGHTRDHLAIGEFDSWTDNCESACPRRLQSAGASFWHADNVDTRVIDSFDTSVYDLVEPAYGPFRSGFSGGEPAPGNPLSGPGSQLRNGIGWVSAAHVRPPEVNDSRTINFRHIALTSRLEPDSCSRR